MIVVSDTSPFYYLLLLEYVEVLPQLYGNVLMPVTVQEEMLHPAAPSVIRANVRQYLWLWRLALTIS